MGGTQSLSGGFAEPVMDAQAAFRALMAAMAEPGTLRPLEADVEAPEPLSPEAAAVMLTLCDADTPVWLDQRLAATPGLLQWIAFHCGAPVTAELMDAHFAFVSDARRLPPLGTFCAGTQEYPDRSTTLIVQLNRLSGGEILQIAGPGIDGSREVSPHLLPARFTMDWAANRDLYPRGVDLVLVAPGGLAALPRTTRILSNGSQG